MADDKKAKKEDKPKDPAMEEGDSTPAPEGAEGGAPADGGRKAKLKKIGFFVALPLVLILGGGGVAYMTGMLDKMLPGKHVNCEEVKEGEDGFVECEEAKEAQEAEASQGGPGTFVAIPDMIVNLNSTSKQPRFLKVALKIELDGPESQKKLDPMLPRVIDQFQMYLRELRIEDLRGTSGIYRMKIELLSRVRAAAPDVKVRDVLFQEILVQ